MTQNFKGDATELKMQDSVNPLLDITNAALDDFYANGFDANDFLIMLYDQGRMPFSDRIPRDAFVDFVRQALQTFPFSGTFEIYLFILKSVFGDNSEIRFQVPSPGILEIDVEAVENAEFTFIAREFVSGSIYNFFDIVDYEGDTLVFRGIVGIDNEYELNLLFSEIIPAGIVPHITLGFFQISDWAGEGDDLIVGEDDNGIIFIEGGA